MKEFLSRGGGSEKQKEIVGVNKEEDYKERMMKGLCERIWDFTQKERSHEIFKQSRGYCACYRGYSRCKAKKHFNKLD